MPLTYRECHGPSVPLGIGTYVHRLLQSEHGDLAHRAPDLDLETWLSAFGRFAEARREAGVVAQRVYQPVDDDEYIFVDLDFDSVDSARKFKDFLETVVWQSRDLSPGLAGTPRARILRPIDAVD
jgi:hypothetical protein